MDSNDLNIEKYDIEDNYWHIINIASDFRQSQSIKLCLNLSVQINKTSILIAGGFKKKNKSVGKYC